MSVCYLLVCTHPSETVRWRINIVPLCGMLLLHCISRVCVHLLGAVWSAVGAPCSLQARCLHSASSLSKSSAGCLISGRAVSVSAQTVHTKCFLPVCEIDRHRGIHEMFQQLILTCFIEFWA